MRQYLPFEIIALISCFKRLIVVLSHNIIGVYWKG